MTDPSSPLHPPSPHPDPDVTTADDIQVTYYEGSPKLRGELGLLFVWTVIGLLFIAIPSLILYFGGTISRWYVVGGVAIALLCWSLPSLLVRREYYRITNYRIDVDSGLLFKEMDTLELWHVEDVSLRQSPLDQLFNVGTITIVSHDRSNPKLLLRSLSHPRQLLETLKTRIIAVKRQRGVMKVDAG
ncbi:MAG: PH domain-containing protein [Tepidisphaeraceae bacterium]